MSVLEILASVFAVASAGCLGVGLGAAIAKLELHVEVQEEDNK